MHTGKQVSFVTAGGGMSTEKRRGLRSFVGRVGRRLRQLHNEDERKLLETRTTTAGADSEDEFVVVFETRRKLKKTTPTIAFCDFVAHSDVSAPTVHTL